MYIPSYARLNDQELLWNFMEDHPFATLVTTTEKGAQASHFPFLLDRDPSSRGILWTHVARANPQWREIEKTPKCLVIFQGPHAYISPSLYVQKLNVPTWNYTAVHAECRAEIFDDAAGLEALLERTVLRFEKSNPRPWQYDLPAEFRDRLVKGIVGVRLKITDLSGKFKLSQNRDPDDYAAVVRAFESRSDESGVELLRYMRLASQAASRSKE